jgi:hypothetical protein
MKLINSFRPGNEQASTLLCVDTPIVVLISPLVTVILLYWLQAVNWLPNDSVIFSVHIPRPKCRRLSIDVSMTCRLATGFVGWRTRGSPLLWHPKNGFSLSFSGVGLPGALAKGLFYVLPCTVFLIIDIKKFSSFCRQEEQTHLVPVCDYD